MFNSIREFTEAMLEGRVFKYKDITLQFDPHIGFFSLSECGQITSIDWRIYKDVVVEVIQPK